jgi:ribonuclease R
MSEKKKKRDKGEKLSQKTLRSALLQIFIKHPAKSFTPGAMAKKIPGANNKDSMEYALDTLVEEGLLTTNRKGKYKYKQPSGKASKKDQSLQVYGKEYTGRVDMTKSGAGYLVCDDLKEDVYVPARFLNGALNNDIVTFKVQHLSNRRRPEGEVIDIVKRSRESFIGTLYRRGKRYIVVPDGLYDDFDIFVPHEWIQDADHGDKVIVKITTWPGKRRVSAEGKVTTVFGKSGSSDIEMKTILINQGFELEFPEEVIEETAAIPARIPENEIKNRRDMRSITTFTIDPEDAKDFDDAISFRILENENLEIGVHIADVSYYVQPGSALDKDAYKRSTSVYLVDRVLPMLPERLSNELCSLRPDEDKLTYSAIFEFNSGNKVIKRWFGRTIIHSDRRFSYEQAQEVLEKKEGDFADVLTKLNEIAKLLRKDRFRKGSIDFDSEEVKFKLDDEGRPIELYVKERKDAHFLIEEFMLLANREVAEFISTKDTPSVPFVYRVHDLPNMDKLKDFSDFAREIGFKMELSTPKQIAMSFNTLTKMSKTNEVFKLLEPLAIRTMAKAEYSSNNIGHYGLGFSHYTHFTSPIRRYSDVIAHRILERNLRESYRVKKDDLEMQCRHISLQERKAMDAERESLKYKQVEYISQFKGKEFEGVINGMIDRGVFVELKSNKCEGLIPFDRMSEPFHIEESRLKARGLVTGKRLKMGDTVRVIILDTDLAKRQIEMDLVE